LFRSTATPTGPVARIISLASGTWNSCKRQLQEDFNSCCKFTQD